MYYETTLSLMEEIKKLVSEAKELPLGNELEMIFENEKSDINPRLIYDIKEVKEHFYQLMVHCTEAHSIYIDFMEKSLNNQGSMETKQEYLYNFNWEITLALSRLVSLIMYSDIKYNDIKNYYETLLNEYKLSDAYFFEKNMVQTCSQYARYNNINEGIYNNPDFNLRPIVIRNDFNDELFISGGKILNPNYSLYLASNLWQFNMAIIKSFNYLDQKHPDFEKYNKQLMEGWLRFFKLLDLLGHTAESIGRLYSVFIHVKLKI